MPDHAHAFGVITTKPRMHAIVLLQHIDQRLWRQALWVEVTVNVGKHPGHRGDYHGNAAQTQYQARGTQWRALRPAGR
ncbi:hypothetical protein D3C81_2122280 [compost metagenome]